ncbi:hypothetical protein HYH03_000810 [Edaphochlamys debaryana]|uniref:Uncharacterized protein n=1 Tax=Edaphochlamys debaryana TaxID=47281 RepID=A0A835YE19_9CHLO|nr:hypothetical protein HYH03_000810 [Edaphochlamys debaryana]|eukprot:KAG2500988.1 hypothetical protein HYH03_000810 [Edaphochlamys debaryana]
MTAIDAWAVSSPSPQTRKTWCCFHGFDTPMMYPETADIKIMERTHDQLMAKAAPFGLNPPAWKASWAAAWGQWSPVPKERIEAPMIQVNSLAEGFVTAFVMHGPKLLPETRSALQRERCKAADSGVVFVLILMEDTDFKAFCSRPWESLEGEDEHAQLVAAMRCTRDLTPSPPPPSRPLRSATAATTSIVPVVSVRGGFIAADSVGAAGIRDIPVQLLKAARMHRAGSDHVVRQAAAARAEAEAAALAAAERDEAAAAALAATACTEAEVEVEVLDVLMAGAEGAAEALAAAQAEEDERVRSLLGWESAVLVSAR